MVRYYRLLCIVNKTSIIPDFLIINEILALLRILFLVVLNRILEYALSMSLINIVMAQINPLVGDIETNTNEVIRCVMLAQDQHQADVVVFPELTLCGYPPEDLLLRDSMEVRIQAALQRLAQQAFSATVIVGYPRKLSDGRYNMAGVLSGNEWVCEYAKQQLPNFQVFDEKRYFTAGAEACVFDIKGVPTALSICEDIWHDEPLLKAKALGAKLLININASPFHRNNMINVCSYCLIERNKETCLLCM